MKCTECDLEILVGQPSMKLITQPDARMHARIDDCIYGLRAENERLRAELDTVKNVGLPLARRDETFGEYRNRQS